MWSSIVPDPNFNKFKTFFFVLLSPVKYTVQVKMCFSSINTVQLDNLLHHWKYLSPF